MFDRVRIGVALGAGGARGLAHLGVLDALESAGIRPSFIAGSSIGALVGAAYALAGAAAEPRQRVLEFLESDAYAESGLSLVKDALTEKPDTWSGRLDGWLKRLYLQAKFVTAPSILDADSFRSLIEYFLPKINIEDLPIPFRAVGTDLRSGRPVVFTCGSLRAAVYASSAIPGLVTPLEYKDMLVVDGGVVNMVPVGIVRKMGADVIIAVDVEKTPDPPKDFGSGLDTLFRVEEVQNAFIKEAQLAQADLVIRPAVGHIHWSGFGRAAELIQLGADAAAGRMDEIEALARRRTRPWDSSHPADKRLGPEWIMI